MRKKAGKSTFLGASVRNTKAQHDSPRAAGHPSSASSLDSRRGGRRRYSAAKKKPRLLQTPPLLAANCPPLRGF